MEAIDSPFLKQVVNGLVQGDEACFEKLYGMFSGKIYAISRKMRLGHEDAEGVVQEVFLKIWKNREKLDPELSINAYMIAILRSLVIKKVKKEARFFAFKEYQIPLLKPVSSYSADGDLIYSEFHNLSLEIIEKLPPAQRQIFKLRHLENQSVGEISEALNLSKRTVENQIFRATKSFKEGLAKLEIVSTGVWVISLKAILASLLEG
ncbi:RNA polymerase sigma factor [Algoriphagus sp. Y33]|uniref:RNA polymerase sigma factor n=1 Tax=Algoriphagus sp. Y33 TaxID=2772483 RepID=UPI0017867E29|nr:sigma-70 family RNA polymerase sigma factor [Algoriphagus sp. Y33]